VASPEDSAPQIVFSFPATVFNKLKTVRFDGFLVCGGFASSLSKWQAHARPRAIVVSLNGQPTARAELRDVRLDQLITFKDVQLHPGDQVTIKIVNVYPGASRLPVAIAAIVPQGAH
jgi:hypothetical protein